MLLLYLQLQSLLLLLMLLLLQRLRQFGILTASVFVPFCTSNASEVLQLLLLRLRLQHCIVSRMC